MESDIHNLLAQRAEHYQQLILDVSSGPGGMIVSFPRFDTRRPFQEGEEAHWYLEKHLDGVWGGMSLKPTMAEWLYGENTLWATGMFLWSQILRYRATQAPKALETARKCFRDLNNIFRLSREIEPGLLGKPHGGRGGPTTSYDQSASPVLFYVAYAQELATADERAEATANMALHGDYYLRRNWIMNHHGHFARIVDPAHTSTMKYLACVYAAYEMTGEVRFREAVRKYLRQIVNSGRLPWPTPLYEMNHNICFYYPFLSDYWSRTEMADEADWKSFIRLYWQATQTALDDEGLVVTGTYDSERRHFTPYPAGWVDRAGANKLGITDPSQNAQRWVSPTAYANRSLVSVMAGYLALLARSRGIDDNAHLLTERTLQRMDESTLRWWWDDGSLPKELKPLLNIFAPESVAFWLVTYWQGRQQGLWSSTGPAGSNNSLADASHQR